MGLDSFQVFARGREWKIFYTHWFWKIKWAGLPHSIFKKLVNLPLSNASYVYSTITIFPSFTTKVCFTSSTWWTSNNLQADETLWERPNSKFEHQSILSNFVFNLNQKSWLNSLWKFFIRTKVLGAFEEVRESVCMRERERVIELERLRMRVREY